ncbi:hypothetical protein BUE80_DR005381 [Diplocarpon rosae]|nr:hypothetical protein BUE80_DR005381 [Diplocarpon rosae]
MATQVLYTNPNAGQSSVPSHFLLDLDQQFPRIPVTPSMLYTHAHMRGFNPIIDDPLHSSVYIHPIRAFCTGRVQLALVSRRHSIAELPKFSTLFWDPINSVVQPQQPQQQLVLIESPVEKTSYAEHIERVKPAIGTNHYKGDMGNANFGYIKIGDIWCDPDSELELSRAVHIHEYAPVCEDRARVKPLQPPVPDSGPRIMTPEEEDEFYRGFVEEVTDEQDGEGDPRQYRISPAVFARWAAGAVKGERYEEEPWWPPSRLPSPDPYYENQIIPRPCSEMQFDVETGSVLSGIYENDPEPRVLLNAQGVNFTRPPVTFSYSYPQASLQLDRAAFSLPYPSHIPSSISTPSVYNSEAGVRNLGSNASLAGEQHYDTVKHAIELQRAQVEGRKAQLFATADAAKQAAQARILLAQEIFFLKARVVQLPPALPSSPPSSSSPKKQVTSPGSFSLRDAANSSARRPKRKKQYERYIAEELERQAIALPGLIPKREPSGRDLRTQFGLRSTE